MRIKLKKKPRKFTFRGVTIKDLGKIYLKNNEMVSFVNTSGKECDFAQKSWGFYTCPSINGRLKNEGFKTALALNKDNRLYVLVVDENKINDFKKYIKSQKISLLCWLDEWIKPEL